MAVDAIAFDQGLYFQSAQVVKSKTDKKDEKIKRNSFASALEKSKQEYELLKSGFPKEIAGMDTEEAAIFLKDEADKAGEFLKEKQTQDAFAEYRKKVSQFLRFLEKNNFAIKKKSSAKKSVRDPYITVVTINQKLDELAQWLLKSHKDTLKMLSRIGEIKGLLVDLMAT